MVMIFTVCSFEGICLQVTRDSHFFVLMEHIADVNGLNLGIRNFYPGGGQMRYGPYNRSKSVLQNGVRPLRVLFMPDRYPDLAVIVIVLDALRIFRGITVHFNIVACCDLIVLAVGKPF